MIVGVQIVVFESKKKKKGNVRIALWVVEGTPSLLRFAQWAREHLPPKSNEFTMKGKVEEK